MAGSVHPVHQFILLVIGRLFTAFPGVLRQLESSFVIGSPPYSQQSHAGWWYMYLYKLFTNKHVPQEPYLSSGSFMK